MTLKLFVSFSGKDSASVSKLLSALRKQNLDVWDYTRAGERIPPGADVMDECKRHIDKSDCFLAYLSVNSFSPESGRYPQEETRYAIVRQSARGELERLKLIPVSDISVPLPALSEPYRELEGVRRLEFDGRSQMSADEAVRSLCKETLKIDYVLPVRVDPRIRLIEHFRAEWKAFEASPEAPRMARDDYARLDRITEEFSEEVSHAEPDWQEALFIIVEGRRLFHKNKLDDVFYFPLVMKGLCETELREYDAAERTFRQAVKHPRVDGHAYAGLAQVHWQKQEYAAALENLRSAAAEYGDSIPWELRFNMICAVLASGGEISVDDELLRVNPDVLEPEDWAKYKTLLGVYYFKAGRYSEARDELGEVIARESDGKSLADESTVTWYADCLIQLGQKGAAVRFLGSEAKSRHDGALYYRAAHLSIEIGDVREAALIYDILCSDEKLVSLRYLVGYARVLRFLGNLDRMREICRKAIEMAATPSINSAEDHFNLGFAHYLLGDVQLAKYELSLSGEFRNASYASLSSSGTPLA